jgi:hypothetical protein
MSNIILNVEPVLGSGFEEVARECHILAGKLGVAGVAYYFNNETCRAYANWTGSASRCADGKIKMRRWKFLTLPDSSYPEMEIYEVGPIEDSTAPTAIVEKV